MWVNDREPGRSDRPSRWPFRTPLLLAALCICVITGLNLARLIPSRSPRNPWEATEVMEGWRSLHGVPVYDLSPQGHATHLYGALVPWVHGEIFRWVGTNNISGRLLTLASALATVTLIVISMRTTHSAWHLFVAWAALLGLNHRTFQYFCENRPDMTSLFFTTAALLLVGLGVERRRRLPVALGTLCFILGFFFKQTAFALTPVPLVALILRGRRPTRAEIALAATPLAAALGVVLALKTFRPEVSYYMLDVLRMFRIDRPTTIKCIWDFLQESPLFLVLLADWIIAEGGSFRRDRRMPWLMATLAVGTPYCAVAYAKFGGTNNSLLPIYLAMMAFCALRLPDAARRLEDAATTPRARVLLGGFAATLLLFTVFPHPGVRAYRSPWDASYERIIRAAEKLPGTVLCPEDPTIPLYAKAHAGRNVFNELDAHTRDGVWVSGIPDVSIDELRTADFVVDIQNYLENPLTDRILSDLGFTPVDGLSPDPQHYRIWRRPGAGSEVADARNAPDAR